jgi:predicted transglutaminase-like cysteine proteinase
MAMGSGHPLERDAVGDARMVFLVALSLKQARCALTWLERCRRFSTKSGLAECPDGRRAALPRSTSLMLLFAILAGGLLPGGAGAKGRLPHMASVPAPLVEASLTLAPFQHVRFCLRYPGDCRSNQAEDERIDLTDEMSALLDRVNRSVNAAIAPIHKGYGRNLAEAWTIAPLAGDCNDYAVTKRHELLRSGLPAKALRLAAVKTSSGIGHLVLLAATTKGELVLDNLTEAIVPWQEADYQWKKIQSAEDARSWYEVQTSEPSARDRKLSVVAHAPPTALAVLPLKPHRESLSDDQ